MASFITTITLTAKGIQDIHESPKRAAAFKQRRRRWASRSQDFTGPLARSMASSSSKPRTTKPLPQPCSVFRPRETFRQAPPEHLMRGKSRRPSACSERSNPVTLTVSPSFSCEITLTSPQTGTFCYRRAWFFPIIVKDNARRPKDDH